ncbi:hypothetical protein H4R34_000615 [Dimargaris verticillata]|uniref:UPF3 domain-containing protein n=1 Tax=Dimargaris verticillata TaxID=2761393 RepID=A0A9W8B7Q4_9FUNG|nr:hypothetical protein H4R34_000615 [Dimargaris verticillata]
MDKPSSAANRYMDGSASKPRRPRKKKPPSGTPTPSDGSTLHPPGRNVSRPDQGKPIAGGLSTPRAPPASKSNASQTGDKSKRRRRPHPSVDEGSTASEAAGGRGDRKTLTGFAAATTATDPKPGRKSRSAKPSGAAAKPKPKPKTKPLTSKRPEKPLKSPRAPLEKLKIVIRRLPPTLPEAVFWQAVAPHVPFPPPDAPTTTHTVMVPCDQFPADSQEYVRVQAKPISAQPHTIAPAVELDVGPSESTSNGGGHHGSQNDAPNGDETELAVPRRVCRFPIVAQTTWHEEYVRWYIPGKMPKPPNSHMIFSRAYICFAKAHEATQFHQQFNGHLFVDKQGRKYPALVEFAPCQLYPRAVRSLDPLAATIDEDPDFQAFATVLQGPSQPSETEPLQRLQPIKATDAPTVVVGTIAVKPNDIATATPTSTPLLDYLRDKRLKEAWSQKRGPKSSKPTKLEHGKVTILKKSFPDGPANTSKPAKFSSGKKATESKPAAKAKKILKRSESSQGAQGTDTASKPSAAVSLHAKKASKKPENKKKKSYAAGSGASVKSTGASSRSKLDKQ